MMYNYGFYNPFAGVISILFWVLVIALIIALIRHAGGGRRRFDMRDFRRDGAMDILREKYAKGEITKEEFDAKKKDLSM